MKIYVCLAISLLSVSLCTAYVAPAVLALGECDCPGIIFGGRDPQNPSLTIFNSGIHVNSPYNPGGKDGAIDLSGNAPLVISAHYINVVGGIDENFDILENMYVHDYRDGINPEPDPYAHYLPNHDVIAIRSMPDNGTIDDSNSPQTYEPGYYSGGMQISGGTVELLPGDYYLDSVGKPASISVTGGLLVGEGVTLHIIGDADMGIEIQGNADIDIAAPESGTYAGVAIYEKRNPDYDCAHSCTNLWSQATPISELNHTGVISIDGAVYMPHNRLELGGTGDIFISSVIADRFYIYGNGQKVIGFDSNYYVPGDLNRSGAVDFDDLIIFSTQWGDDYYDPGNNLWSDFNYDMNIDLNDFAIFASHWLEVAE